MLNFIPDDIMENEYLHNDTDEYISDKITPRINFNDFIVGAHGSGKSMTYGVDFITKLEKENAVIIAPKKEMCELFENILLEKGYKVIKLDFSSNGNNSIGYDPLQMCDSIDEVTELAKSIVTRSKTEKYPYWKDVAEGIIKIALRYVYNGRYASGNGLLDAVKILDTVMWHYGERMPFINDEYKKELEKRNKEMKDLYIADKEFNKLKDIDSVDYLKWLSFVMLPESTGGCVTSELQTIIEKMFSGNIREILGRKEKIDFKCLLEEKTAILVSVSPVMTVQNSLINIFYKQLLSKLFNVAENYPNHRLPYDVRIFADDFATGCPIPDFAEYISVFRSKGISVTILVQSETQLINIYGVDNAATIMNNCDKHVFMGGMDIHTCESFSKKSNLPFDEVFGMEIGKQLIIQQGQPVIKEDRRDVRNNQLFIKIWNRLNRSIKI